MFLSVKKKLSIDEKVKQTVCSAVSCYFAVVFFMSQLYPFSEPEPTRF